MRLDLIYWSGSAHSRPFSWYYYGRIETTVHPVHMEPSVIKWQAGIICESICGALYFPRNVNGIPDQEKEGIWKSVDRKLLFCVSEIPRNKNIA